MIIKNDSLGMLELLTQPAFCVKEGTITQVNHSARQYLIQTGTPIAPMLGDAAEEYALFTEGCLMLTLTAACRRFSASVTSIDGLHVFILEPEGDQPALRAMALAAQELRNPMADLMAMAERLFPELEHSQNDNARSQILHMNRSMYQMMRVICNMSDAARYAQESLPRKTTRNICGILEELFEKTAALAEQCQIRIQYQGLTEAVYTLLEEEKLERAVLNMLSNAMKFTKQGGTIYAQLTRRGNRLNISIQDDGRGMSAAMRNYHQLYQRQPSLEDPRYGLGLGMEMIRSCASAHGGTVLITHPSDGGTKITMSLAIHRNSDATLHTDIQLPDYAGERNHCLLELSECLPVELYSTDIL